MKVVDFLARRIAATGVQHVFAVGGANIEQALAAVQCLRPQVAVVLAKHEFGAGTMADAYARVTGGVGVVFTTSGGGAMNLVPALAEARASNVPVLAIVGEPPTPLQGRGAFQDTSGRAGTVDAAVVFAGVSVWTRRVGSAEELPILLEQALTTAREEEGPAVLLLAKDLQAADVPPAAVVEAAEAPAQAEATDALAPVRAAHALRRRQVAILAGDGVGRRASARTALARLAEALDATVAVTPDARDAFDNGSPRFVGVAGAMGHAQVKEALDAAQAVLVVGTRLPWLARNGLEEVLARKALVVVSPRDPFVRGESCVLLRGDLEESLQSLLASVEPVPRRPGQAAPSLPIAVPSGGTGLRAREVVGEVAAVLQEDATVLVDAGNTGAEAVHGLPAPRRGRWLLADGMAGMGYTFGAAVGAALGTGRRCYVLAGDGSFLMHGLEIHTAVEHQLPITYVLFNDNAHGMCALREQLFLGEQAGHNQFRPSHLGAGLAAMFPGLRAVDCRSREELSEALAAAAPTHGPCVVCAELRETEAPPFVGFATAAPSGLSEQHRGGSNESSERRQVG